MASSNTTDAENAARQLMPPPAVPPLPPPGLPPLTAVRPISTVELINTFILYRMHQRVGELSTAHLDRYYFFRCYNHPIMTTLVRCESHIRGLPLIQNKFMSAISNSLRRVRTAVPVARDEKERDNFVGTIVEQFIGVVSISHPVYSWGTLIMILVAVAEISVYAFVNAKGDSIRRHIIWTIDIFKSWRMNDWIERMGGWSVIVPLENSGGIDALLTNWELTAGGVRYVVSTPAGGPTGLWVTDARHASGDGTQAGSSGSQSQQGADTSGI